MVDLIGPSSLRINLLPFRSPIKKILVSFPSKPPPPCFDLSRQTAMTTALPSLAIPGQQLGSTSSYAAGPGTHVHDALIYASIAGPVVVDQAQTQTQTQQSTDKAKTLLTVSRSIPKTGSVRAASAAAAGGGKLKYNTLPSVDSVVLTRVTRVQKRQATVSILVVVDDVAGGAGNGAGNGDQTDASDNDNIASILSSAANPENHSNSDELRFQALIRKEDVRAVEKDRVVMDDMFRVGDIVRGTIVSLGDQSFYYLTTARNDLGVVMARSEAGNMMFPVSWKEMRDSVTGGAELRKVARPF